MRDKCTLLLLNATNHQLQYPEHWLAQQHSGMEHRLLPLTNRLISGSQVCWFAADFLRPSLCSDVRRQKLVCVWCVCGRGEGVAVRVQACVHMHVWVSLCVCVCMSGYICVCVCVCQSLFCMHACVEGVRVCIHARMCSS